MHVIVFPGWYPNRRDALSGDFIQRHMDAIALNCKVTVVVPVKDQYIEKEEHVEIKKNDLTEKYIYYPSLFSNKWLDSFFSFLNYNRHCLHAFKKANKENKVDVVHLYVLQKNVLVGILLKLFYGVPYVISEQSTFYIDGGWEKSNSIKKRFYKLAFNTASSVHTVSQFLLNNIYNELPTNKSSVVIPNVVNSAVFHFNSKSTNNPPVFVHVSNMVYQKNVEGMLHAFSLVKAHGKTFSLSLVGPVPAHIPSLIKRLDLEDEVKLFGQKNNNEVAEIMQQSDVFVFFTRYETFGCVIIEANACGLPVIVSNLEVTNELITENENGIFVESESVGDLANKIIFTIDHLNAFEPEKISKHAIERYNYQAVSKRFLAWYQTVIGASKK